MPGGLEVTLPLPPPVFTTERVGSDAPGTVSVVLPLFPEASVAVIVVVPGPTPVATPEELMVATAVLLLVHVTPVALHRHRSRGAGRGAVAELAPLVHAPAPHPAVHQQRAAVVPPPGGDVDGTADSADRHRCRRIRGVPVPELAELVLSPAAHATVSKHARNVWRHPTLTSTALLIPTTCTGVVDVPVVPFPSCPTSPSPQQRTVPSFSTAHV